MKNVLLRAENLRKEYEGGFSLEIPHLEFEAGKTYGLVGPNGAGKTTLLSLLNFLKEPTAGEIFFREEQATRRNSLSIRRRMHMVMEDPYLFRTTVFKNIISGLRCRSVSKRTWPQRVERSLKMVGLQGSGKRNACHLSRGEAQRVAIARGLALEPEVLFLDEPFTNVDRASVRTLERLVQGIDRGPRTTIVFTTHDLWQASRLSHEVLSLVEGKLVEGSLENLFKGTVEERAGARFVSISPKISLSLVTKMKGKVNVTIPPQDIVLSHRPLESSARNSFLGVIRKIEREEDTVRITAEVAEEVDLVALITKASYEKMNLVPDSRVYLTFKSTAIKTF